MISMTSIKETIFPDSLINSGYGEFIILSETSTLDKKTFELCHHVLTEAKQLTPEYEKRKFLEIKLTQIDPTIKMIFIPRTLYELCFIKKCLKETLHLGDICKNSKSSKTARPESTCWHRASFRDFGDDQDDIIIDMAYRLNNSIASKLKTNGPLTYSHIVSIANKKLCFLELCHLDSNSETYNKLSKAVTESESCVDITENMIDEFEGGSCKPLGIKTKRMKEIVLNAIALECSSAAKGKLILYRGAIATDDRPLVYNEKNEVNYIHSLSYGTGLFAGGMYDPGATAFYYIRKEGKDASALLIPQEDAASSPFAIPTTHTLCQMFGRGEKFHARSKAPTIGINSDTKIECRGGPVLGKISTVPSHFLLEITPQHFDEKFQYYIKNCVVNLKG